MNEKGSLVYIIDDVLQIEDRTFVNRACLRNIKHSC